MKKFDLTTEKGMNSADLFLTSVGFAVFGVPGVLAAKALGWAMGGPSEISPERQADAAEKIIAAGKANGAKKMKIKLSRKAGGHVKAKVEKAGIDIGGGVGTDGTMELEVTYK